MRAHCRPHFVQKNRCSSPIFQRDWVYILFCDDQSRLRAQKNGGLYNISKQRTLFVRFCALGSCRHIPLRYVISALSTLFPSVLHAITAAACHRGGNSRDCALIATHPVCLDRLTPQTATTSYVISSAIRAKSSCFT